MDKFWQTLESVNGEINSIVWGTFGLLLLVGTGIIVTILTKFFQVTHIGMWFKHTLGSLFKKDVIFSCKLLSSMGNGIQLSFGDYAKTLIYIVVGLVTGNIKPAELKAVIDAIVTSGKLTAHYEKYPDTPDGYEAWAKEAELLWAKTGKVAEWDSVDKF